ncbi:DUF2637 domain-containing protein [Streptomyces sp. NPDC087212]|uniref:DUF2637 domain-containing protein n=1 Tax=Streptomyces sp. NPDC087212 TaxID=3365766 RepID=UPI0038197BF6
MHRVLIGVVVAGAVVIAGIGFAGSYAAVRELALQKGFGNFAYVFPIGIDAGICVLLALDLLLTWIRIPFPLLRQTAWLLTAATIAFNGAAAWPDPLGTGMHAVIPVLFVVAVEAARHAIGRIADITADRHMEGVRLTRWMLSPLPTFLLWRRMKLWELRSYEQVIKLEQERLVYQARLRSRFGRAWRRKAPVESLMPLRLARYGVPLAETAPAGLAAAGIEPLLIPAPPHPEPQPQPPSLQQHPEVESKAPHPELPAPTSQQQAPQQPAEQQGEAPQQPQPQPEPGTAARPDPEPHPGQNPDQRPGQNPDQQPGQNPELNPEQNPWFKAPHQTEYQGGYDPQFEPEFDPQEYADWFEEQRQAEQFQEQQRYQEQRLRERQYQEQQQLLPDAPPESASEETGSFPIPVAGARTRELGEGGGLPEPDEDSYYQVFKKSISGSGYPTPREYGENVEAEFSLTLPPDEAKRMVNRFTNRYNAELEEDHIA